MTLEENPYIREQLDNLHVQFGNKALLTLDDYCALFGTSRPMASRHLKKRGIPYQKIGQEILIPILELARFLARNKALQEGKIVLPKPSANDAKNNRGFRQKALLDQLVGS